MVAGVMGQEMITWPDKKAQVIGLVTFQLQRLNARPKQLGKGTVYLGWCFQEDKSSFWQGSMAASSRYEGQSKKPRAHVLHQKRQDERKLKSGEAMHSQSLPQRKATPPKPPQTAPLTVNEIFKCLCLWGAFPYPNHSDLSINSLL